MENNLKSEIEKLKREVWSLSKQPSGGGSITLDNVPTAGSNNAVKSSGIKSALDLKADISSLSSVATSGSYVDLNDKPITSFSFSNGVLSITIPTQETESEEE